MNKETVLFVVGKSMPFRREAILYTSEMHTPDSSDATIVGRLVPDTQVNDLLDEFALTTNENKTCHVADWVHPYRVASVRNVAGTIEFDLELD